MAISRMQEPRQLYGLGSLVKKIGKTIKKVVKSPIGKAAILGIGAFGLPGGALGMKGFLPQAFKTGASNFLFGGGAKGAGKFLFSPVQGSGGAGGKGLFGLAKKFIGSTAGQIGVGTALSALAASGMDQEEIAEIENDPEKLKIYLRDYYSKTNPDASDDEINQFVETNVSEYAVGGRVGLESGTPKKGLRSIKDMDEFLIKGPHIIRYDEDGNRIKYPKPKGEPHRIQYDEDGNRIKPPKPLLLRKQSAMGGLQSMPMGQMRMNKVGTIERDYRETGGFVPVGIKEKADDVPAMLSKNEFVMTADAVRGMGDGNIEKGAQRLYDQMKQAEKRVV